MTTHLRNSTWTLGLLGLLTSIPAMAQDAAASPFNSGDIAWLIASSAFVLLMTPGLAFFYGGMVRGKNAISMIAQ